MKCKVMIDTTVHGHRVLIGDVVDLDAFEAFTGRWRGSHAA